MSSELEFLPEESQAFDGMSCRRVSTSCDLEVASPLSSMAESHAGRQKFRISGVSIFFFPGRNLILKEGSKGLRVLDEGS